MFLFFFLKRILNFKIFGLCRYEKDWFLLLKFEKSYSNHAYVYALELSVY